MASLENMTTEQLQESTRLFHSLLNSPDTREATLRLIKKKTGQVMPEIDAADSVRGDIAKEREARQALEARIQEREIMDRIEKERTRVKKDHQLSDADVAEVEKLMVDKDAPIPSYAAAAKVYKASKQVAEPTAGLARSTTYSMPEKDVWAPGIGNKMALNKIAIDEAYKAQQEFRSKGGAV